MSGAWILALLPLTLFALAVYYIRAGLKGKEIE